MKMKRIFSLVLLLIAFMLLVPTLSAQVSEEAFPLFLNLFVRRQEAIKNLQMPEVETRTAPGFENEAAYLVTFQTQTDFETFIEALKEEGIPYGFMDSSEEYMLILFYSDLLGFIMKAAIGL